MFLLDTNVLSELRKVLLGKANPRVVAWSQVHRPEELFLSAITIMEVELGILRLNKRDSAQAASLRAALTPLMVDFRERVLPVDEEVALSCARLHAQNPRPERDALIAATALVHGMTIATRNTHDFAMMGVPQVNPWE